MHPSPHNAVRWRLAGIVVFFGLSTAVFWFSLRHLRHDREQIAQTESGLRNLSAIPAALEAADAALRAFLLSGREGYLESLAAAQREGRELVGELRALLTDDEEQLQRLEESEALIARKFEKLNETVQVYRTSGREPAQALATDSSRRELNRQLNGLLGRMKEAETAVLAEREELAEGGYWTALATMLVTNLVGAGLASWLLWWFYQELRSRAAAEGAALSQRERLQVILASIGDGVIVADRGGRVVFLNPVAQNITGWPLSDAIGQPVDNVYRIREEQGEAPTEASVGRALREGNTAHSPGGMFLVNKNGREFAIDDSAAPVRDGSGEISGAVVVFRDVSDRRRLQLVEQSQREMAAIDQQRKDEFLAMLAHELRNPLAPIANALQLMATQRQSPEEIESLRAMMERQVEQMIHLIEDLLDVSRITKSKFDLEISLVDVRDLVRDALDTVRPLVKETGHALKVDMPAATCYVRGDPVRLTQVLINLLNNACKYTAKGGTVELSVECQEERLVMCVRDTGIGLAAEDLERIFEIFAQVDGSITRARGGLGVGLTLARNIVRMHGGEIVARSEGVGKGSEFVVWLPLSRERPLPKPKRREEERPAAEGPPRRILIVDDMQASVVVMSKLLTALGHEVKAASDGPGGLEAATQETFDLIISDIAMPGMSGYELAQSLRRGGNLEGTLLVALTGYGQEEDVRRAKAAGFDAHLTKPVGIEELRRVVALADRRGREAVANGAGRKSGGQSSS